MDTIKFDVELPIFDASQESNWIARSLRKIGIWATKTRKFEFEARKKLTGLDDIKRLELIRQVSKEQIDDPDFYDRLRAQVGDIERKLGIDVIELEYFDELEERLKDVPLGAFTDKGREEIEQKRKEIITELEEKRQKQYAEIIQGAQEDIEKRIMIQKLTSYREAIRLIDMTAELQVALTYIPPEISPIEKQETAIVVAIWNRYREVVSPFRLSWIV